jgi:hypothetical protein
VRKVLRWLSILFLSFVAFPAKAQEMQTQPAAYSVWIDLQALHETGKTPALPIWLESIEKHQKPAEQDAAPNTTYRLRFRKMEGLHRELLVRLHFVDRAEAQPEISAWTETGNREFYSGKLGSGIGLPTSESLVAPVAGVDYMDLDVTGDGGNLLGIFLSSVRTTEVRHSLDFELPATLADPFQKLAPVKTSEADQLLFGRVKALLAAEEIRLSPEDGNSVAFQFELESQPSLAVLTFEVLNADVSSGVQVMVNGGEPGSASIALPDLADPAYREAPQRPGADVEYRYAGWLKCQKIISGSALHAGQNQIVVSNAQNRPVAIRAVEMQLKYHWKE